VKSKARKVAIRPRRKDHYGYKWTTPKGHSWHDQKYGPYKVGKTMRVAGAKSGGPCGVGLHVGNTIADAVSYGQIPGKLFRVRGIGPVLGEDDSKRRYRAVKVERALPRPIWLKQAEALIAWLNSRAEIGHSKPNAKPRKTWKHFSSSGAAWDALREARGGVWVDPPDRISLARTAMLMALPDDRRRALSVIDNAISLAAARAGMTTFNSREFALLMLVTGRRVVNGQRHRGHMQARLDVWNRGYGLVGEAGGKLYTHDL
jgi:hypothetical protein